MPKESPPKHELELVKRVFKRKKPIPMAVSPRAFFKILKKINNINSKHKWTLTAFCSFLYLTGARISEGLAVKRRDIEEVENGVYVAHLKTLKSKIYPLRRLPIAPIKSDKRFYKVFNVFLGESELEDEDYLFPFASRFVVNDLLRKIYTEKILQLDHINKKWIEAKFRLHPHYIRHCRLSHLASNFGFNEIELMKFAGWSSSKPCIFYIKLDYKDILKKMLSADVVTDYMNRFLSGGGT